METAISVPDDPDAQWLADQIDRAIERLGPVDESTADAVAAGQHRLLSDSGLDSDW